MRAAIDWLQTRWGVTTCIVICVSIIISAWSRQCGLLLTSDSYNYLSAGESLITHGRYLSPDGTPFVYWPPLFPTVLSMFNQPETALYWLNFVLIIITGVLLAVEIPRHITHPVLQTCCLLFNLAGVQFMMTTVFLWSELLFIMLSLVLIRVSQTGNRKYDALIVTVGFLLCLQRNAGVFFIVAWAVATILTQRKKILRTGVMSVLMLSGNIIWNVVNSSTAGSGINLLDLTYFNAVGFNFSSLMQSLATTLFPAFAYHELVAVVVILTVATILRGTVRASFQVSYSFALMAVYLAGLTVLSELDIYERDRYLSVVIPFFSLIMFAALQKLHDQQTNKRKIVLLVLVVCWLSYPLVRTLKNSAQWREAACQAGRVAALETKTEWFIFVPRLYRSCIASRAEQPTEPAFI